MAHAPIQTFDPTIGGFKEYLAQCSSADLATVVRKVLDTVVKDNQGLSDTSPLDLSTLSDIRTAYYNLRPGGDSLQWIFAHADQQKGVKTTGEQHLRFIEALQQQLQDRTRLNFTRAFAEVTR